MVFLIASSDEEFRFKLRGWIQDLNPGAYMLESDMLDTLLWQCNRYRPNVVLLDVDMPGVDGIKTVLECRKTAQNAQYVVISGGQNFQVARECIAANVTDYLIKPLEEGLFRSTYSRLLSQLSKSLHALNNEFQVNLLRSYALWDEFGDQSAVLQLNISPVTGYLLLTVSLVEKRPGYQAQIVTLLNNIGDQWVEAQGLFAMNVSANGVLRVILGGLELDDRMAFECDLEKKLLAYPYISLFKCHGTHVQELLSELKTLESRKAARLFVVPGQMIDMAFSQSLLAQFGPFLLLLQTLLDTYLSGDIALFEVVINKFSQQFPTLPADLPKDAMFKRLHECFSDRYSEIAYPAVLEVMKTAYRSSHMKATPEYSDKMDEIRRYVDLHYFENLGVSTLANKYLITPNYLSTMFKKRHGLRFVDYITQLRISNAKSLLLDRLDLPVKMVSLKVGYSDARYFSTVFQKVTGVLPSDYRRMMHTASG